MANEENNGHGNLPANTEPTEVVPLVDMLYGRMEEISSALLSFYEMVASAPPDETEAFMEKYPLTAAAKLRVAPIALSKVLPVKKQVQITNEPPRKRLAPTQLVKMGVGVEELKKLAGIENEGTTKD